MQSIIYYFYLFSYTIYYVCAFIRIISYYIISYYIILYCIVSYYILLHHDISYCIVSYNIAQYQIMCRHHISYNTVLFYDLFCYIISYHNIPCILMYLYYWSLFYFFHLIQISFNVFYSSFSPDVSSFFSLNVFYFFIFLDKYWNKWNSQEKRRK